MNHQEHENNAGLYNGDKTYFDFLFRSYYPRLCIYANSFLKSIDTSEEVVQDVFVKIWENHAKIFVHTSIKAYLYKSVFNACVNYIKSNQSISSKYVKIEQPNIQLELLLMEGSDSTFDQLFTEQVETEFEKAIESLPAQCRDIFRLCRNENLTYPEIANQLNVSVSTVKTQMSRTMDKLIKRMGKYL
jgi:RNA polymerase sigma-70 factor, ECF subfamily